MNGDTKSESKFFLHVKPTWILIFMDCVCERLRVAPEGCLTLVGFPRLELPVLLAEDELVEDTEDTPMKTETTLLMAVIYNVAICWRCDEPEIEDEPLAIEYKDAEAGTFPATHLPPGPVTPTGTPVPMLYSDALCGRTQDFPDIEYYKIRIF